VTTPVTSEPSPGTPTPADVTPAAVTPDVTAPAGATPSPTALHEGLVTRLGTPDPSPNCPDHYPWFWENPAQECAAVLEHTWAVWQEFEHGRMVWFQNGGLTYVLLDDGSPFRPYHIVTDPLGLPLPEPDPNILPPPGLFQPERGFALYWRGLVPGHEWVRDRLGWATALEAAYPSLRQCNTATDAAARCYVTGPRDEILAYTTSGPQYWSELQGAVR
jgi:hypothetical protein